MSYKYFIQDAGRIKGPGETEIIVSLKKRKATVEEVEAHISAFVNNSDVSEEEKKSGKERFYEYLHNSGKSITAGDKTFICKLIRDVEQR